MPQTVVKSIHSYASLRSAVREAISRGRERALSAVERQKVRTAWQAGRLILKHILHHKSRADYGKRVIQRLARDLGMSQRSVAYMVEFAREYPILHSSAELTLAHYRALLGVNHVEARNALESRAKKGRWSVTKLRQAIRQSKGLSRSKPPAKESLALVQPNPLDVFRTHVVNGKTVLDLGFSTYFDKAKVKKKLKIVSDRSFTYRARVERVVDGDTIWCVVDLGFGIKTRQKLRLRGINSPELQMPAGERAKRYLVRKLRRNAQIIIGTSKADKFDRYLADIWADQKYINQQLVKAGHAVVAG